MAVSLVLRSSASFQRRTSLWNETVPHGHGRAHDNFGRLYRSREFVAIYEADISRLAPKTLRTAVGRYFDHRSKTPAERCGQSLGVAASLRERFTVTLSFH